MTADEFVSLVGQRITHVTLEENLPGIAANGLMRPSTLALRAGVGIASLTARTDRMLLHTGSHSARLNSQDKLLMGRKRAAEFLDGHTIESWSAQLDHRVFFWAEHRSVPFGKSHGARATAILELDARKFFQVFRPFIDLAPINTGNADRAPALRGDWIYVSAEQPLEYFKLNRVQRGLVKSLDHAREISVRADLPADVLKTLVV